MKLVGYGSEEEINTLKRKQSETTLQKKYPLLIPSVYTKKEEIKLKLKLKQKRHKERMKGIKNIYTCIGCPSFPALP